MFFDEPSNKLIDNCTVLVHVPWSNPKLYLTFFPDQGNTTSLITSNNSLPLFPSFQTACEMKSHSRVLARGEDGKNPDLYY